VAVQQIGGKKNSGENAEKEPGIQQGELHSQNGPLAAQQGRRFLAQGHYVSPIR
jgi:hypothetical protein